MQDIFISTNDYQFETIPDAVIGRIAIDNIAIAHAKKIKGVVVDITQTGHHVHEGIDRFSKHQRKEGDRKYNLVFFRRFTWYTGALNNADMVYNNSTKTFMTKQHCDAETCLYINNKWDEETEGVVL